MQLYKLSRTDAGSVSMSCQRLTQGLSHSQLSCQRSILKLCQHTISSCYLYNTHCIDICAAFSTGGADSKLMYSTEAPGLLPFLLLLWHIVPEHTLAIFSLTAQAAATGHNWDARSDGAKHCIKRLPTPLLWQAYSCCGCHRSQLGCCV